MSETHQVLDNINAKQQPSVIDFNLYPISAETLEWFLKSVSENPKGNVIISNKAMKGILIEVAELRKK